MGLESVVVRAERHALRLGAGHVNAWYFINVTITITIIVIVIITIIMVIAIMFIIIITTTIIR